MKCLVSTLSILLFNTISTYSQCTYSDKYCISTDTEEGHPFKLYSFSREGSKVKAKYFAQDAIQQLKSWGINKNILLITAGAFTDKPKDDPSKKPVGLCVDNGKIVNRTPDENMDGMVIVYNGGDQIGGIVVVDLDVSSVRTPVGIFNPRTSAVDRFNFLAWGESNSLTLFQTQLLYSSDRATNPANLFYGDPRERRFLAICRKRGITHHVIIDAPEYLYLNLSAKYAKKVLERNGFSVLYILNLDTGDHDILYAQVNGSLVDQKPKLSPLAKDASNLLVYYID